MSGVGYLAAAYTVSRFLIRPRRRAIRTTPAEFGLTFQSIALIAEDGITLAGWLIEPPQPRGTVALFHGMRHNRGQMLSRIRFLTAAGYRCLCIDHRAHGESGGKRISFGWYEARDVRAVARWIAENYADQPRFALGISMGAAAVCFAGPDCGWSAVILEGIYADLRRAFRRRIGALYPAWFGELYPATVWFTQKRLRVRLEQIRPVDAIQHWRGVRVLGLTGTLDPLAPLADMIEVLAACPGEAAAAVILGAGHNDVCEVGGAVYRDRLIRFLEG
jgi:pimeloyl-ACP methyl ester carboxylesterase